MGFTMYAYAHASEVKMITVTSIADFRNEITEKTPSGNGVITNLASSFRGANGGAEGEKRAPFNFTWKPEKGIPKTLFTGLKRNEQFTLELTIAEVDAKGSAIAGFKFNFYQCKYIKSRTGKNGQIKIEASFGLFRSPH